VATWQALARRRNDVVSVREAARLGISPSTLRSLHRRGILRRFSHGVYVVAAHRIGDTGETRCFYEWPQNDDAVLSGLGALTLWVYCRHYDSEDCAPTHLEIVVPRAYRVRRALPKRSWGSVSIRAADINPKDVRRRFGFRVLSPLAAIRAAAEHGPLEPDEMIGLLEGAEALGLIGIADRREVRSYLRAAMVRFDIDPHYWTELAPWDDDDIG
jgi:hypothetical protein